MKILIVGHKKNIDDLTDMFPAYHTYLFASSESFKENMLRDVDMVFDFDNHTGNDIMRLNMYSKEEGLVVWLNTVKRSLLSLTIAFNEAKCTWIGFNGLPTFLNNTMLEVCLLNLEDTNVLQNSCEALELAYKCVDDRVGMVTPRIVCMIINEAYYTVQEGTAERDDIDLGMRLGTNYPYGPFEWCKRIGIDEVYEVLAAIYEDTKDERYKICPLLKKEYLMYCKKRVVMN